ncbi:hypothetical protein [Pseudomonas sp. MWU12-2323]|uniref:hypothetical protein n=1 Tax=Pseudomonas sp. MWU12-2323 TaxID=2651296 RepID=UPI00128B83F8|nr:hypothetical protein [Pseudomonas sp. MWU12-2323]MPQ69325.1 hypothetical protein [Pseudomonas sp. MWU12-2323]
MKHLPLVMVLAVGLSGCDAAKELGAKQQKQFRDEMGPMTFAFVPGYKVTVGGLTFPIYGKETCPEAVTAKVFIFGGGYDYPGEGTPTCVVVEPETEKVSVRRVMDGALVDEIWRVDRNGEALTLWAPDGKPVVTAAEQ